MQYVLYLLFALSGIAGLIYEATWARYLKIFLGHSSYGQILTLVIYMGGLGLGSFLAARLLPRIKRPLFAYALTELAIGVAGVLYHPLYVLTSDWFYGAEWTRHISVTQAWVLKVSLGVAITTPVAILLGMTFPFVASGMMRLQEDHGGSSLPRLYFANSFGAAIGILLASFVLIPQFGSRGSLYSAAVCNLVVFAGFLWLDRKTSENRTAMAVPSNPETAELDSSEISRHAPFWLMLAAITGLTSFVYEIGWIRLLSMMLGSSTHSFDLMVSAFVLGLALGGHFAGRLLKKDAISSLGWAQVLMGIAALCTIYWHEAFFILMNQANMLFASTSEGYVGWTILKYAAAVAWMLPACFFAGTTLPLITYFLSREMRSEKPTGWVYGWNTLGAITGAALGGLVLLPALQLKWTLASAALVDIVLGLALLCWYRPRWRTSPLLWITVIAFVLPLTNQGFNDTVITAGVFRDFKDLRETEEVQVRHGRTATISFHESKAHYYISTNGKPDASLYKARDKAIQSDELTQAAAAFTSISMRDSGYDAAMVGFGSGMCSHYLLSDPLLRSLDIVEIEGEMISLARNFLPHNKRPFEDPRVHMAVDDARTYFHTSGRTYDLIVSVPSNPWVSGVSSLFSVEFYQHMRRYLRPGGHMVQWLQLYEFEPRLLMHILKALKETFPHFAIYKVPDEPDILIVASDQPVFQRGAYRLLTDSVLHANYKALGRPDGYFGEQNFLSTGKALAPLLDLVQPNSEYVPLVDVRAEEARYTKNAVWLFEGFDSALVNYSALTDPEDYKLRKARRDSVKAMQPLDAYLVDLLNGQLANDSVSAWHRLYADVLPLFKSLPADGRRDSLPGYRLFKTRVDSGAATLEVGLQFTFEDLLVHGKVKEAAALVPAMREVYDMKASDPWLVRNAFVACMLAGKRETARELYRDGLRLNGAIDPAEKRLAAALLGLKGVPLP